MPLMHAVRGSLSVRVSLALAALLLALTAAAGGFITWRQTDWGAVHIGYRPVEGR